MPSKSGANFTTSTNSSTQLSPGWLQWCCLQWRRIRGTNFHLICREQRCCKYSLWCSKSTKCPQQRSYFVIFINPSAVRLPTAQIQWTDVLFSPLKCDGSDPGHVKLAWNWMLPNWNQSSFILYAEIHHITAKTLSQSGQIRYLALSLLANEASASILNEILQ